jgi:hypothetical protein
MKKKCDGYDGLYRDDESGVISNRSSDDRSKYRQMKQQASLNMNAQTEISQLKSDIDELKSLVHQLIQKNGT